MAKKTKPKPDAGDSLPATKQGPEPSTGNDPATYQTLKWITAGHDEKQIREALAAKYPDADPAKTLRAVMEHLANVGAADPQVIDGWCFESARDLYQKMVEVGDFANALRAIKEIHRLAHGGK